MKTSCGFEYQCFMKKLFLGSYMTYVLDNIHTCLSLVWHSKKMYKTMQKNLGIRLLGKTNVVKYKINSIEWYTDSTLILISIRMDGGEYALAGTLLCKRFGHRSWCCFFIDSRYWQMIFTINTSNFGCFDITKLYTIEGFLWNRSLDNSIA